MSGQRKNGRFHDVTLEVLSDLAVLWSRDRVIIESDGGIYVWSLSRQEELFRISIEPKAYENCMALSKDKKILFRVMEIVLFAVGTRILVSLSGNLCQVIRKKCSAWLSLRI